LGKAALRNKTKLFVVGIGFLVVLAACEFFLPDWVTLLAFLGGAIFVAVPLTLGIGPLGRRFAKELNEAAVAERDSRR